MNDVLDPVPEIMQALQNHLQTGTREWAGAPVSHVTCGDGTVLSVQAGRYHYCEPRNNEGPWTHVEVTLISNNVPLRYFDVDDDGIAGGVPLRAVAHEVYSRGSIKLDKSTLAICYFQDTP